MNESTNAIKTDFENADWQAGWKAAKQDERIKDAEGAIGELINRVNKLDKRVDTLAHILETMGDP